MLDGSVVLFENIDLVCQAKEIEALKAEIEKLRAQIDEWAPIMAVQMMKNTITLDTPCPLCGHPVREHAKGRCYHGSIYSGHFTYFLCDCTLSQFQIMQLLTDDSTQGEYNTE